MDNMYQDPEFKGRFYGTYEGPPTTEEDEVDLETELAKVQELIRIASKAEGLGCQTDKLYT